VLVPDVDDFPGHIACDPASRSELVVPLIEAGQVSGVLDLDSPLPARFDAADREGCERLVVLFVDHHCQPSAPGENARHIRRPRASGDPGLALAKAGA
jgi:putative methionine-R-sulfoxide reductase with GAF domain